MFVSCVLGQRTSRRHKNDPRPVTHAKNRKQRAVIPSHVDGALLHGTSPVPSDTSVDSSRHHWRPAAVATSTPYQIRHSPVSSSTFNSDGSYLANSSAPSITMTPSSAGDDSSITGGDETAGVGRKDCEDVMAASLARARELIATLPAPTSASFQLSTGFERSAPIRDKSSFDPASVIDPTPGGSGSAEFRSLTSRNQYHSSSVHLPNLSFSSAQPYSSAG